MKTVVVGVKGISPLLINRFQELAEQPQEMKRNGKKDYGTPRQQAEGTAYRDDDTLKIWIPTLWFKGSMASVSSDYKIPGSRKSVKSIFGGVVLPVTEKCYFAGDLHLKDIEIDSRPVVIQRARVMRHRARLEAWAVEFELEIDDSLLGDDSVHQILTEAGRRVGVGDFRPQKGGPFGRFIVTKWEVKNSKIN